jgi:hypothetical protein
MPFPFALLGNISRPMPMAIAEDFEDFTKTYTAADWTIQQTGAGTTADTAGNGGLILQTTTGANNDQQANIRPTAKFAFINGNQFWFVANLQISQANTSQFTVGVMDTLVALAPTNGVYFDKPLAGTQLNFVLRKAGVSTTIPIYTPIVAATNYAMGFYFDGRSEPTIYAYCSATLGIPVAFTPNRPFPGGVMTATASAVGSANPITNLPVVNLAMGVGVKTGSAAVITMTTDYVYAACDVARF